MFITFAFYFRMNNYSVMEFLDESAVEVVASSWIEKVLRLVLRVMFQVFCNIYIDVV